MARGNQNYPAMVSQIRHSLMIPFVIHFVKPSEIDP
jgi:hypothetical protein